MASNLFVNKLSNKCMGGLFGRKKGKQRKKGYWKQICKLNPIF